MATESDLEETSPPLQIVARLRPPSPRGVTRLVAILAANAVALYLLYLTRGVLKLLVIAVFAATALGPLVDAVQRTRLPRAWAIIVVYLACALAIAGVGVLIVPSVGTQIGRLVHDAEHAVRDLRGNATFRRYDDHYHLTAKAQTQLRDLPSRVGRAVGPLRDVTVGALGFAADLIAVLSMAFLLMLRGDRYTERAIAVLSSEQAERWRRLRPQVHRAVSGYVLGNLTISVIAGAGSWLALTVLRVPFALPLAIVIALFDLVPMVGATLGSIIVALAALLVSPLTAVLWLAYTLAYQQVENYVIQPIVYRRAVEVSPLASIVGVLVGGTLLGVLGALLAIPSAAVIQLVWQDLRGAQAPIEDADGTRSHVV
jgi:predicted PurR-regulated permease PerM